MAPALARLKRRSEFLRVAAGRLKWAAPGLVLQARKRIGGLSFVDDTAVRVGYTASRKVGNAVARNRARRRLRAVADQVVNMHAEPGYDFVIIARGLTVTRPFPALVADMTRALKRVGAYRASSGESKESGIQTS